MATNNNPVILRYQCLEGTPVGRLLLAMEPAGLRYLLFEDGPIANHPQLPPESQSHRQPEIWETDDGKLDETVRQLTAWFRRDLKTFDVPLAPNGTDFQRKVWAALADIPWGHTATYGEIARAISQPAASRAVGLANGRNPISIIVPCHRVIGSNGRIVGYGGGLHRKKTLLQLEGSWPTRVPGEPKLFDDGHGGDVSGDREASAAERPSDV